jgi:hypothetical protein
MTAQANVRKPAADSGADAAAAERQRRARKSFTGIDQSLAEAKARVEALQALQAEKLKQLTALLGRLVLGELREDATRAATRQWLDRQLATVRESGSAAETDLLTDFIESVVQGKD